MEYIWYILGFIVVAIAILAFIGYRVKKKEQEILDQWEKDNTFQKDLDEMNKTYDFRKYSRKTYSKTPSIHRKSGKNKNM